MFKELVKKLYNAPDGEKSNSPIWRAFVKENVNQSTLKERTKETWTNWVQRENKGNLDKLCSNFVDSNSDKFWEKQFLHLRDIGCKNIDINKDQVLSVASAGEQREVTFAELNSNVLDDYENILNTQTAIPESVLFEKDKKMLMANLKNVFLRQVQGKSAKESEEILSKIQKSVEAQHIKDIQSLEAEVFVQKMLIDLGKKENITMVVFRGINTYGYIGQFLEKFGLRFSKLRYLYGTLP